MAVESGTAILSKDLRMPPEDLCGLVPLEDFRQSQLDDLHFYLAEIDDTLNNYADGIPKEIIHSTSPNPFYKARRGWIAGSLAIVADPSLEPILSSNPLLCKKVRVYGNYYSGPCFRNRLTREQDINRWNNLLTQIRGFLIEVKEEEFTLLAA